MKQQQTHLGLLVSFIVFTLLTSCASNPTKKTLSTAEDKTAELKSTPPEIITPLSPYSTTGLTTLSQLRQGNPALNTFLEKNRKPDYFFSTRQKKIYCIYLNSDNLYTFNPQQNSGGPIRFHPLPKPIKKSLNNVSFPHDETQLRAASIDIPFGLQSKRSLEASLKTQHPQPYLDNKIIQAILSNNSDAKNNLYYYERSLTASLENQYSAKYEQRKHSMKLIFPQEYDSHSIYHDTSFKAKKIYLKKDGNNGAETSLIVPDFFPSSDFYRSSYANITPAFASLYQIKIKPSDANLSDLYWRYIIRPCQKDNAPQCVNTASGNTKIRAIVIAATLYNKRTRTIIETLTLK